MVSIGVCAGRCLKKTFAVRTFLAGMRETDRLLALYRFWGSTAMISFALFLALLAAALRAAQVSYALLAADLCAGFLWIGATSLSRHSLIMLKDSIRERVGLLEFLSTQFAFLLFPLTYLKVKKEVQRYTVKIQQAG